MKHTCGMGSSIFKRGIGSWIVGQNLLHWHGGGVQIEHERYWIEHIKIVGADAR